MREGLEDLLFFCITRKKRYNRSAIGGRYMKDLQFYIELEDKEWERTGEQKDRHCARAIVVDDEDRFYFVQITRDDLFGLGTYIETAGGGLEENENAEEAVKLYESQTDKKLGRLLTNRELPILKVAKQWIDEHK